MKTSSAKAKGRNLQKYVRDTLLGTFALEPDDIRSTSMGSSGEDIQLSPAARELIPCSFECKSYARMSVYKIMEQAKSNCPEGIEPIGVLKQNRSRPLAVMDFEYFVHLLEHLT